MRSLLSALAFSVCTLGTALALPFVASCGGGGGGDDAGGQVGGAADAGGDVAADPDAAPGTDSQLGELTLAIEPATATVGPGATLHFKVTDADTGAAVTALEWTSTAGSVDADGVFTAPTEVDAPLDLEVTATSTEDPTVSVTAVVTVDPDGASLEIIGGPFTFGVESQHVFQAAVAGVDPTTLRWSVSPPLGRLDAVSGLLIAPFALPDPAVAEITVRVEAVGQGLADETTLRLVDLAFDPREVVLWDAAQTATVSLRAEYSDGTSEDVFDAPGIALELLNPEDPVALRTADTLTATEHLGLARLQATWAATGAAAGMRIESRARRTLHVPEGGLSHGIPGFDRPLRVELRAERGPRADEGDAVEAHPNLSFEVIDGDAAVVDDGVAPDLDGLIAWLDSAGRRVVFGRSAGTATIRATLDLPGLLPGDAPVATDFEVTLQPTWMSPHSSDSYGAGGVVDAAVTADMLISSDHARIASKDLLLLIGGLVDETSRWNYLDPTDLPEAATFRWWVEEGAGYFVGPELGEENIALVETTDIATGVYGDGPLAGKAWATRRVSSHVLGAFTYGFWNGQRGSVVRFVATRPGPVVIKATIEGSAWPPEEWSFDATLPVFEGVPFGTALVAGNSAAVVFERTDAPALPQQADRDIRLFPAHRVEVMDPNGALRPDEELLTYLAPTKYTPYRSVWFQTDLPGTWKARVVFDIDGEPFAAPGGGWTELDVATEAEWAAGLPPAAGGFVILGQSDSPLIPNESWVTARYYRDGAPFPTELLPEQPGGEPIKCPDGGSLPLELSYWGAAAGIGHGWEAVPGSGFIVAPSDDYCAPSLSSPSVYPAIGSDTLQLRLRTDPEGTYKKGQEGPVVAVVAQNFAFGGDSAPLGVAFDVPYIAATPHACATAMEGGGWYTEVRIRGNSYFASVRPTLTADAIEILGDAGPYFSAVTAVEDGDALVIGLVVDLEQAAEDGMVDAVFSEDPLELHIEGEHPMQAFFDIYRVWLSGWQPDLGAEEQTEDDAPVGMPLNARFAGYRQGVMPLEVHVQGNRGLASVTYRVETDGQAVHTATQRDDGATDPLGLTSHAPLEATTSTLRLLPKPSDPDGITSVQVMIYGDLADDDHDGLPDHISGPGQQETVSLWCGGRQTDALSFTKFRYVPTPLEGTLTTPAPAIHAKTPEGAAAYAAEMTLARQAKGAPLDVYFDVDASEEEPAGALRLLDLAHRPEADTRAGVFRGERDAASGALLTPSWGQATGARLAWGLRLDSLCFDPGLGLTPETSAGFSDLYPGGEQPDYQDGRGFLEDDGGLAGGFVGLSGEDRGKLWLAARTPGTAWPGLDCGYPLRAEDSLALYDVDDDLEDVALRADGDGAVDLDSSDAHIATFTRALDANTDVHAGLQVVGKLGFRWTTEPALDGAPWLPATLRGVVAAGTQPVPGTEDLDPATACDDLVVTARRNEGGSANAKLALWRLGTDVVVGVVAAVAAVVLLPAAAPTLPLWAHLSTQGGMALVSSYMGEVGQLGGVSSYALGRTNSEIAQRAAQALDTRLGRVPLPSPTTPATVRRLAQAGSEGIGILGSLLGGWIKHRWFTQGGSDVHGSAEASTAETFTLLVPADAVTAQDTGARAVTSVVTQTVSLDHLSERDALDVEQVPSPGGESLPYLRRCASSRAAFGVVLAPGDDLSERPSELPDGVVAGASKLADFRIRVAEDAEPWRITRSASAHVSRTNGATTARARVRAEGEPYLVGFGLEIESILRPE